MNPDTEEFETAKLLKARLLELPRYKRFRKEKNLEQEDDFEQSFDVIDDEVRIRATNQFFKNPAALMKKELKFSHHDLLESAKNDFLAGVKGIITTQALSDVSHIKGLDDEEDVVMVFGEEVEVADLNPMQLAIFNSAEGVVLFFLEAFKES